MTYYNLTTGRLRDLFGDAYSNRRGNYGAPDIIANVHYSAGYMDRDEHRHDVEALLPIFIRANGENFWFRTAVEGTPDVEIVHLNHGNNHVMISFVEPSDEHLWMRTNASLRHLGTPMDGEPGQTDDLVITPLTGWGEGFSEVRPNDELLSRLPAGARPYATQTVDARGSGSNAWTFHDGTLTRDQTRSDLPSAAALVEQARNAYRAVVMARFRSPNREEENKRLEAIRIHRAKTAANFSAFVRDRPMDTEAHIGKLPFVPHGLSSSRRWGIEIEHPGARGVNAPDDWDSKGDGSLRSAYDGYVEVQDFEPYDEERTERIQWSYCDDAERHSPRIEIYDDERDEYIYVPNEDYVDPRECELCGVVTRTVRVEPQTIHHRAQSGDCKEFVSPILVSMHSNGLEQLLDDLKGRPTNSSAGVHVHVEADDLSNDQIATLVYGYDILEPILEASYKRDRRDFCERRSVTEVLEAARKAKSKSDDYDRYAGGRYRTLNTHALSDHGTIEFRAMGPVYEYDYLVRWAMLLRELVNSVAAGATTKDFAKIKSWDDLVMFIAKFGKEYIRAAVYEMTGETGSQAALSKGDEPVTQSALDRDLETVLSTDFTASVAALNRMSEAIRTLGIRTDELVGVAGLAEV